MCRGELVVRPVFFSDSNCPHTVHWAVKPGDDHRRSVAVWHQVDLLQLTLRLEYTCAVTAGRCRTVIP